MASRTMHLTIANEIIDYGMISNIARFSIGQILPDAITHDLVSHGDSHFKATVCDGKKKLIDFVSFRNQFEDEIKTDDLYLGYYLHLIQDAIYRKFLYYDYGYKVFCSQDIEVLHNDYRLLNTYLITKYQIKNCIQKPEDFENEKINNIYPFALNRYLEDMENDFLPYNKGGIAVFTEQMVDEYINICSKLCKKEMESNKIGGFFLNPMDYAWDLIRNNS